MKQVFSVPYYSVLKNTLLVYKYVFAAGILVGKTSKIITITKIRSFSGMVIIAICSNITCNLLR